MTPALAAIAPPGDPQAATLVAGIFLGAIATACLGSIIDWLDDRRRRPLCLCCSRVHVDITGDFCSSCAAVSPKAPRRGRPAARGVVPAPDRRWEP